MRLEVSAFTVPTDGPESDGTIEWDSTTAVVVEVEAEGETGLGYTYCDVAAAHLVDGKLRPCIEGHDPMAPTELWRRCLRELRNTGAPGIGSCALAAVDVAAWDLKARLLDLPLCTLLGEVRPEIPVYGSGGFTSYTDRQLREQFEGWVGQGIRNVKMKVGREPDRDLERVRAARSAIGDAGLMIDANGAYGRKQALRFAERVLEFGVHYFEEPVSSDDLEGLRLLRDRSPLEIAAGEYAWRVEDFRLLVDVVDVLQADATRCGGVTGFMLAEALALAHGLPLSAHTAPHLHAHLCCAALQARDVEYFHDHVRVERLLFDGALPAREGVLVPDRSRPGLGLELRRADAEPYRKHGGGG